MYLEIYTGSIPSIGKSRFEKTFWHKPSENPIGATGVCIQLSSWILCQLLHACHFQFYERQNCTTAIGCSPEKKASWHRLSVGERICERVAAMQIIIFACISYWNKCNSQHSTMGMLQPWNVNKSIPCMSATELCGDALSFKQRFHQPGVFTDTKDTSYIPIPLSLGHDE